MPHNIVRGSDPIVTRRRALTSFGVGIAGLVLAGCGGSSNTGNRDTTTNGQGTGASQDFAARFAAYQPADEPNADPSKVVWPEFVTRAGPEVQRLYEFALVNGELMRYMPCFCGCGASGHRNNRDCYIKAVNPDGSVVFDDMAPT